MENRFSYKSVVCVRRYNETVGDGNLAFVISPKFAPFPPTNATSSLSISENHATNLIWHSYYYYVNIFNFFNEENTNLLFQFFFKIINPGDKAWILPVNNCPVECKIAAVRRALAFAVTENLQLLALKLQFYFY